MKWLIESIMDDAKMFYEILKYGDYSDPVGFVGQGYVGKALEYGATSLKTD